MIQANIRPPDDDEVAAALAAIQLYIERSNYPVAPAIASSAWRVATALEAQDLPPVRNTALRGWASADRARRASRWSTGII